MCESNKHHTDLPSSRLMVYNVLNAEDISIYSVVAAVPPGCAELTSFSRSAILILNV